MQPALHQPVAACSGLYACSLQHANAAVLHAPACPAPHQWPGHPPTPRPRASPAGRKNPGDSVSPSGALLKAVLLGGAATMAALRPTQGCPSTLPPPSARALAACSWVGGRAAGHLLWRTAEWSRWAGLASWQDAAAGRPRLPARSAASTACSSPRPHPTPLQATRSTWRIRPAAGRCRWWTGCPSTKVGAGRPPPPPPPPACHAALQLGAAGDGCWRVPGAVCHRRRCPLPPLPCRPHATGETHSYCIRANGGPLSITLVWTDYPASPMGALKPPHPTASLPLC